MAPSLVRTLACTFLALGLTACGSSGGGGTADIGSDAALDALGDGDDGDASAADTTQDPDVDASEADLGGDAAPDVDAAIDAQTDAPTDTTPSDAGADTTAGDVSDADAGDASPDASDASPDVPGDAAPDATQDADTGSADADVVDDPCGNGVLDPEEICDDGNRVTEDACPWGEPTCIACSAACDAELALTGPFCGDGEVNGDEVCDRGDAPVPSTCPYGVPRCDSCSDACDEILVRTGPYCGDAVVDAGELCDDGASNGAIGACSPLSCARDVVRIAAPAAHEGDEFGQVTAISDRWLAVGQPYTGTGAIHVFERNGRDWDFVQRLSNPAGGEFTGFGGALHIVGDEILTPCGACNGGAGALLAWRWDGRAWSVAQQVSPAEAERTTAAGRAVVALSDDTVVLVSEFWDPGDGFGGAWVIEREAGGDWGAAERLAVSIPDVYAQCSAAVAGNTIVLASCEYDSRRGGLFVFERGDDGWAETELVSTLRFPEAWRETWVGLGESVVFLDDETMLLGLDRLTRDDDRGAVAVLTRGDAGWVWAGELPVPREPGAVSSIGGRIAAAGDVVAVGFTRDVDGVRTVGFVLLRRIGDAWVVAHVVDQPIGRVFADALWLALGGGRLAVGSAFEDIDGDDLGGVYIY